MSIVNSIAIPKDTWVKVASGVSSGNVFLQTPVMSDNTSKSMRLTWTYYIDSRAAGSAAPTTLATAMNANVEVSHIIKDSASIDVYVYCKGLNGRCRVET